MRFIALATCGIAMGLEGPKRKQTSMIPRSLRAPLVVVMLGLAQAASPYAAKQQHLIDMMEDPNLMRDEFHAFAKNHNKDYVMVEEAAHSSSLNPGQIDVERRVNIAPAQGQEQIYEQKFSVFKDNVQRAIDLNTKANGKATFGMNKFADLSPEEFKENYMGLAVPEEGMQSVLKDVDRWQSEKKFLENSDYSKDWRKEGVITPVKDQAQCGSCWAFSTVETIESSIKQQFGETWLGSEQQLVSCDHNGDMGCQGGLPTQAYEYLQKHPLDSEKYYPYKSGDGHTRKCHAKSKTHGVYEVDTFKVVSDETTADGEMQMKKYIGSQGPMSIAVDAMQWQLYEGGVMDAKTCHARHLDHAVQMVALDDTDSGYWTVRNSWNTNWGEDGYIRLSKDEHTCFLDQAATVASVKKASTPIIEELDEDGVPMEQ